MSLITSHCSKFQFNRSASTAGCRSAEVATGQTGVCKVEPSSYTPFATRSVSSITGSSSFTRLPSLCVILKTGAGDLELVLEGHRIAERRLQPAWRGHYNMTLHNDGQELEEVVVEC